MNRRLDAIPQARAGAGLPGGQGFEVTALVLQGGGALGSYQAGVVEGLMARDLEPDWVAGISIGAINSAIIAGNPPAQRMEQLRGFWHTICRPNLALMLAPLWRHWFEQDGHAAARRTLSQWEALRAVIEGSPGFFQPRAGAAWLGWPQPAGQASYYDTTPLRDTLERFVDFERLNHGPMRLTVSAVDVESGSFVDFDNQVGRFRGRIGPEHIMASGALPPGFAAVEIEGRHYWDGGLVSNTPLWTVLDACRNRDTLVFQVDLWSAHGPLPTNVYDAQERMKDIQYSSRTRAVTDSMGRRRHHHALLARLLEEIPAPRRAKLAACQEAQALLDAGQTSVIQLIYRDKVWEGQAKDYEFSELTMLEHWATGLEDARKALAHEDWLRPEPSGLPFVTYDVNRLGPDPSRP